MSDPINRRDALDVLWSVHDAPHTSVESALAECINAIRILPSAQPEIIRCKDCKHRPFDSEDTQGFGVEFPDEKCPCQSEDGWYNWRPDNDWFCANAERREDAEIY